MFLAKRIQEGQHAYRTDDQRDCFSVISSNIDMSLEIVPDWLTIVESVLCGIDQVSPLVEQKPVLLYSIWLVFRTTSFVIWDKNIRATTARCICYVASDLSIDILESVSDGAKSSLERPGSQRTLLVRILYEIGQKKIAIGNLFHCYIHGVLAK